MNRHVSLELWSRVRTVNWILGGVGLAFILFYGFFQQQGQGNVSPKRTISRLVFSPDGRMLVGLGSWIEPGVRLGETRAWDTRTGKRLWSGADEDSTGLLGVFLPDGSSFVTVRAIYYSDPFDQLQKHQEYHPGDIVWLRLTFRDTRSGRTLSPGEMFAEVFARKTQNTLSYHKPSPLSIDVAPNGRAIAVALVDGVVVWNAPREAGDRWQRHWLPTPDDRGWRPIAGARFTADSRHLVVSRTDGTVRDPQPNATAAEIWNADTGAQVRSFDQYVTAPGKNRAPYSTVLMALSADRRRIAILAHRDTTAYLTLWDVDTGKRLNKVSTTGFSARTHFDYFMFTPERTRVTVPSKSVTALSPESKGDILSFRLRENNDWRCWIPRTNRVTRDWPEKRFVMDEDEAVSPDGRLRAEPGGAGHQRSVWLYEFGAGKPTIGME